MHIKIGRIFSFSAWLEALRGAVGRESVHLFQVCHRRLAAADSKMPVFG